MCGIAGYGSATCGMSVHCLSAMRDMVALRVPDDMGFMASNNEGDIYRVGLSRPLDPFTTA